MKNLICVLTVLLLIACRNSETRTNSLTSDRIELVSETNKKLIVEDDKSVGTEQETKVETPTCSNKAVDFLKLKEQELQYQFFFKLDSLRKVQYPENDQEVSIMVDLTPEYLNKFLADINKESLKLNNRFEKEYHFNIAPEGYTDPDICKDKIEINFDEEYCSFRVNIYNTFLAEPNWCTESMVVYIFEIRNGKIIHFWRNEAG